MASSPQQPSIYFSSLELENVRCFGERQILDLTDDEGRLARWTLILGDNGVGKTTLLQCLAWMRPVPFVTEEGQLDIIEPALNSEEENSVLNSLLRTGPKVNLVLKATLNIDQGLDTTKKRKPQTIETGISMQGEDGLLQERQVDPSRFLKLQNFFLPEPPIFAYGATRRMGLSNLEKSELSDPLASLFSSSTELYDAEEILLNLDYLSAKKSNKRNKKRLEQVKQILAAILPDIQDKKDIHILGPKVLGHPDEPSGVRFKTPYGLVPLSGLSLGYQTTLAWTVDLASRFYERYPDSPDPLAEPAIVLIDEVDLHLHPRWQRRIMEDLAHYFSNTQFIATAHSPLMVQAAANANLAVLRQENGQVIIQNRPQFIKAWRVDQILTSDLFNIPARSKEIESLIAERHALLDKTGRNRSEKERLKVLEEELDHLPTAENHKDQADMDLIRRMAAKLREQFPES